jgi:hypothetical protein
MIIPYNRNAYNYWFLVSFSNLSIWLNLLPIHPLYNGALLSANVFSLVGFTLISLLYPSLFYNHYGETFKRLLTFTGISGVERAITPLTLGIVGWLYHAIPAWMFSRMYTPTNPEGWLFVYLLMAGPFLQNIYPLKTVELAVIGLISYLSMYVWVVSRVGNAAYKWVFAQS